MLRAWALGVSVAFAGFVACTQSYDDFDFSGQTGVGGTGAGSTTTTGTAAGGGGSGAQGGSGAIGGTGGTGGGSGAQGGAGGAGAQGGSGGSGVIVSCQQQYTHGEIADYCNETATECDLGANTRNGDHCDDICAAGGGECLGAYNDTYTGSCVRSGGQQDCATTEYSSGICVCSRGCGSGPPCQSPQICSGGNCS